MNKGELGYINNFASRNVDGKDVYSFDWNINRLPSCSREFIADRYHSPSFAFLNTNWFCEIFPNGRKFAPFNAIGYVSVSLGIERAFTIQRYVCRISIAIYYGDKMFLSKIAEANFAAERKDISCFDWSDWLFPDVIGNALLTTTTQGSDPKSIKISFQVEVLESYIPDALKPKTTDTKSKELESENNAASKHKQSLPQTLRKNLKDYFLNQKFCDVTIIVDEKRIPAHKVILGASSPVFEAMFTKDMAKNLSGEVTISDADPDVLHDVLLHIYSEEVENMTSDNVRCYYKLAVKYDLEDLKHRCLQFMESNLSEINVYDILLLADVHNHAKLKHNASDFIIQNVDKILQSEKWDKFKKEHQVLSMEILEMMVQKTSLKD